MLKKKFNELAIAKAAVAIGALIGLMLFLPMASLDKLDTIIFFTACAVIAGLMDVRLSQGGAVSVDGAVILASTLTLQLPETLFVVTAGTLIVALIRGSWKERGGIGFFVAGKVLTAIAASTVFYAIGGEVGEVDPIRGLPALIAMCGVYFIFDIGMEELSKLKKQIPALKAIVSSARFLFPMYVTFSSLGILLALLYRTMGLWSALFFFLPLGVTRHSFKLFMNIRKVYTNTIKALANAIEAQNPERRGHAERVTELAIAIGRELGFHGKGLELLGHAALLHDIGMLGLEEEVDGELVDHAAVGAEIVEQVEFIKEAADVVRTHHSPYDPERVPIEARVISVASRYDELTEGVAVKGRLSPKQAVDVIREDQGLLYDPKVVRALRSVLRKQGLWRRSTA